MKLDLVERQDHGGSYLEIRDPHGFVAGHIGTVDYVLSYSYAYEYPGFIKHIRSAINPQVTIAYLDHVFVDESRRGRGIGIALMKRILREVRQRGAVHVYGHMAEWKGTARKRLEKWLKKFGFEALDCCPEDKLPVVALTLD